MHSGNFTFSDYHFISRSVRFILCLRQRHRKTAKKAFNIRILNLLSSCAFANNLESYNYVNSRQDWYRDQQYFYKIGN